VIEAIPAALAGERVDRLVAMLLDVSRAEASRLVAAGGARLDGRVAAGKDRVREGQVLDVDETLVERPEPPRPDPSVAVPVVYESPSVIVVDKPAGLVVHPGGGTDSGTLVHGLLARYPELVAVGEPDRPGIVHRLDKGTSGLLVVARTPEALAALVEQLAARSVERVYDALVWGIPEPAGVVDAPIGRSTRDPTRMAVVAGGRPARTSYRTVATYGSPVPCARLECRLETGRTHQIRVHLAAIGHAVVGDATYGGARSALALDRPFLHAARLAFDEPGGGRVELSSPLPLDLAAVVAELS
jgi:23S rRNA pseudouridine1911/1915/1917 synthase